MAAIDDLNALVSNLPNYSLLTTQQKLDALSGALIPDSAGVWPGNPGYVETNDVYFAAVGLVAFLMAQPVVRQSSSEGTSVAVDAPNWSALLAYYRSMSPISQATGNGVLRRVTIPDVPHVRRVSMGISGGECYDDVDTDLG